MKIKEFERIICDSMSDIKESKFPIELKEVIHYVNTLERLEIESSEGIKVILNDGSIFILKIYRP